MRWLDWFCTRVRYYTQVCVHCMYHFARGEASALLSPSVTVSLAPPDACVARESASYSTPHRYLGSIPNLFILFPASLYTFCPWDLTIYHLTYFHLLYIVLFYFIFSAYLQFSFVRITFNIKQNSKCFRPFIGYVCTLLTGGFLRFFIIFCFFIQYLLYFFHYTYSSMRVLK